MKSIRARLILVLGLVEAMTLSLALVLYLGAGRLDDGAKRTREANDDVRDLLSFALLAHRYVNAFEDSLGQRTLIANHERRAAASALQAHTVRGPSFFVEPLRWMLSSVPSARVA